MSGDNPQSRLAALDPTVHFVPGPPSYDAEGGTGYGGYPLTLRLPIVFFDKGYRSKII